MRISAIILGLFLAAIVSGQETQFKLSGEHVFDPNTVCSFLFRTKPNPPIRTYIFVPKTLSSKTRVLLVMHGLSRTAYNYIGSWEKWAGKNDYIVVAPKFDRDNWGGSRKYNLGNMFRKDGTKSPRTRWSFKVVENLYETIREGFNLETEHFDIFGHSAGGQFVHRFMFFMPESKVRIALAANPGWYTLPDLNTEFPYGLKHPKFSYTENDLLNWTKRTVYILRGTSDTERTPNLRQTKEADAQGKNRFERAGYMFERIKRVNPDSNWRLVDVPGAVHSQKQMAKAAQLVLDRINSRTRK